MTCAIPPSLSLALRDPDGSPKNSSSPYSNFQKRKKKEKRKEEKRNLHCFGITGFGAVFLFFFLSMRNTIPAARIAEDRRNTKARPLMRAPYSTPTSKLTLAKLLRCRYTFSRAGLGSSGITWSGFVNLQTAVKALKPRETALS